MNFIENECPRKLRGGFYTSADLAVFLASWAMETRPGRVLEPSCGDGVFLQSVAGLCSRCEIVGWELDPSEAAKARQCVESRRKETVDIRTGDFLEWFVAEGEQSAPFGAVLGNPPFIRYQYLSETQQRLAEQVFARFRLPFTRHTNAWVPFVLASLSLTAPGGRLAMVLPSEILHIRHAAGLREYLSSQCSRVLIIDPEELWFEDAQQGTVVLMAEKKRSAEERHVGVAVRQIHARHQLSHAATAWDNREEFTRPGMAKWTTLLLSREERALLASVGQQGDFRPLGDLANVDVGIVTGANKFFLVSDAVVQQFGLARWARPMFGRSEHVSGLVYDAADHEANRAAGLPTNFLWFDAAAVATFPEPVRAYLKSGEEEGLPGRYKCRVREPWFRVPSVYATQVAMLKRAHHFPRLILNRLEAFTTDTAYRLTLRHGSPESLVHGFLNSLTCLTAELEGRHYGGGVLELVPSEIERLLVPARTADVNELAAADHRFRTGPDPEALLAEQDKLVLRPSGLSDGDCSILHEAWNKLRKRRQRSSAR
jgi:adenine-specific DNA-methyltransferase